MEVLLGWLLSQQQQHISSSGGGDDDSTRHTVFLYTQTTNDYESSVVYTLLRGLRGRPWQSGVVRRCTSMQEMKP